MPCWYVYTSIVCEAPVRTRRARQEVQKWVCGSLIPGGQDEELPGTGLGLPEAGVTGRAAPRGTLCQAGKVDNER